MREQKSKFIKWVKEHKNELILVGVSLTAIILAIRNRDSITMLWEYLKRSIEKPQTKIPPNSYADMEKITVLPIAPTVSIPKIHLETTKIPVNVCEHIRNLPNGYHPSPAKIAEAIERDITLKPNQTLVKSHIRECNVA
ncbi:MAG: hypothetical protein NC395_04365 [Prevotella sp.]|nr:hypothetical protein [Prevotella sp.]